MSTALSLSHIQKRYEHFALNDINLQLPSGEIMGLVGVNGAGKTTLLRMAMGLLMPDAGRVEVFGRPMPEAQAEVKREIGYASEDMRLYPSQNLRWHMDFVRAMYPRWDEAYALALIKRFDLNADVKLKAYSHGQRVKALLLLSLARRPQLLLLDEPTTGLDPVARCEVLEALFDVLRDGDRSVLFSSHNTHDVEQLSDTISFLHQGRLLASQDKERFIDRWRRIVCQGGALPTPGAVPQIVSARQSGSVIEFKVRDFDAQTPERLRAQGLEIRAIEAMNLEDIFITTVRQEARA